MFATRLLLPLAFAGATSPLLAQTAVPLEGSYTSGTVGTKLGCSPTDFTLLWELGAVSFAPDGTFSATRTAKTVCISGSVPDIQYADDGTYSLDATGKLVLDYDPANPGTDTYELYLTPDLELAVPSPATSSEAAGLAVLCRQQDGAVQADLAGDHGYVQILQALDPFDFTTESSFGTIDIDATGTASVDLQWHAVDPQGSSGGFESGIFGPILVSPDGSLSVGGEMIGAICAGGEFGFLMGYDTAETSIALFTRDGTGIAAGDLSDDWFMHSYWGETALDFLHESGSTQLEGAIDGTTGSFSLIGTEHLVDRTSVSTSSFSSSGTLAVGPDGGLVASLAGAGVLEGWFASELGVGIFADISSPDNAEAGVFLRRGPVAQSCDPTPNLPNGRVVWTEADGQVIRSSDLDGSNVQTLYTSSQNGLLGLALDPGAGKIYFTDDNSATAGVRRMNLDGSSVEDLVLGGGPSGIDLDLVSGQMYWTDPGFGPVAAIKRANLDGSGSVTLVTGLSDPIDIEVDSAGGRLWWSDGGTGKIQSSNLAGSGISDFLTGLGFVAGLELDEEYGRLYFSVADDGTVWRVNTDGTGLQQLAAGLEFPIGITVDNDLDLLLVAEEGNAPSTGKVWSGESDGSDLSPLVSGLDLADDVILYHDPVPPFYADVSDACLTDGSSVDFLVNPGPAYAGQVYLILGSSTGTSGLPILGQVWPLTLDSYTTFALKLSSGVYTNFLAFLDETGRSKATFELPPGQNPGLVGISLYHAFGVIDVGLTQAVLVSNAESTELVL